jgi:hypothetical protein
MQFLHTGNGSIAAPILYLGIRLGEWSVSRLGCFTLVERDSGTHCISEWMGPRFDTPVPTEYRSGWVSESIIRYPLTIRVNGSESQDSGIHWISEWMGPKVDTSVPTEDQIGWVPDSVLRSENFGVDNNVFPCQESNSYPSVCIPTRVGLILNPRSGAAF